MSYFKAKDYVLKMEEKPTLFVGMKRPPALREEDIYCNLILSIPKAADHFHLQSVLEDFESFSHVYFSEFFLVEPFLQYLKKSQLKQKIFLGRGPDTIRELEKLNLQATEISLPLKRSNFESGQIKDPYVLLVEPSVIYGSLSKWLGSKGILHIECRASDLVFQKPHPLPDLSKIQNVHFMDPYSAEAFFRCFPKYPDYFSFTGIDSSLANLPSSL